MDNNGVLISVIILNFNGRRFLDVCLKSLKKQSNNNFEIIIVDNGSTDDSLEFIKNNYPELKLVISKKNSFSYGNNLGIKKANGNFILLLNNDVEVDNDFINEVIQGVSKSEKNIGMWATKILNYDEKNIIDSTGLLIYPDGLSRGRGRLEKDIGQFDHSIDVFMPSGCAGIYKKEMLNEIGLLDEDFVFYVEDSDLGFRGRSAGWGCNLIPKAKVYHMYSMTAGKYSPRKAFYVERNRIWFVFKLLPLRLVLLSPFYSFIRYFYQFWGAVTNQGAASKIVKETSIFKVAFILIKVWLFAIVGLPKMYIKRVNIVKKVSNKEIYKWYKKYKISARELSLKD